MSALEVLREARASGLVVQAKGGAIAVYPRSALTVGLRSALLANKSSILEHLRSEVPAPDLLPEDLRDEYEERAAIVEVCGQIPRAEAERQAWWIVVAKLGRTRAGDRGGGGDPA